MSVSVWSRQRGFIFMLIVAAVALRVCGLSALADEPEPAGQAGVTNAPGESKPMCLHVNKGNVVGVLRMLTTASGADIIIGPDVEGTVPAVELTDVTVEEVLDYLKAAGYIQWFKRGNVYVVTAGPVEEDPWRAVLREELLSKKLALVNLRARRTSGHPAVRQLEHEIEELTAELQRDLDSDESLRGDAAPEAAPLRVTVALLKDFGLLNESRYLRILQTLGSDIGRAAFIGAPSELGGDRMIHDPGTGLVTIIRPDGGQLTRWFRTHSGMPPQVTADRIIHDPSAGLVTIINPDWSLVTWLFHSVADAAGGSLAQEQELLKVGEEQSFEFIWPQDRPQYYLEEVEPDLYRRVELADKEGYVVRVRRSAGKAEITVELEMARRTLSGGKYDEAIRAFVGRPMLTKTVVTRTVPLTRDKATLVVWQGALAPPVSAKPRRAPLWAVGEWEMRSPEEGYESLIITVNPNGYIRIPGASATGSVEPSGQVRLRVEGDNAEVTGTLSPSGTGSGMIQDGDREATWTATKISGPETKQGAPPWAVGEWEMTGPGDTTGVLTVQADGTAIWHVESEDLTADPGSVDSSGQVQVKGPIGGWEGTLSGQLLPDGTATGRISPPGRAWTAIRVQAPGIERAAPLWAVGEWEMKVPGADASPALIVVRPDGDVLIEGHPYALTGAPKPSGTLSPWGQLQYRVFRGGVLFATMAGKLNPDGTGSGSGSAKEPGIGQFDRFTWTATKVPGSQAGQRAPAWAVGEWELNTVEGVPSYILSVLADGTITIKNPEGAEGKAEPGTGSIDPSGQLTYKAAEDDWTATMTGRLWPDGTGNGTGHGEGGRAGEGADFTWTAQRRGAPRTYGGPSYTYGSPPVTERTYGGTRGTYGSPPVTELPAPESVPAGPGAPAWAVGQWELTTSASRDRFTANVLPDGTVVGVGSTYKSGNGTIDPNGHLRYRATFGDQVGTLTGALTPEGTGGGMIHQEGDTPPGVIPFGDFWTARQTLSIPHAAPPAPESGLDPLGAPAWAVGQWELTTSASRDRFTANVLPDGTVVGVGSTYKSGNGTIDPNGHLRYRATFGDQVGTLTGALTPEGTGGGMIHQESDIPPGIVPFGTFWTAKRTLSIPHAEPPAPEAVRVAVPILPTAPGPAGVAVLLEFGPADEAPQIPEQIKALIEKPGPEIQIGCKFVEIQKDPDRPLARDWQGNPEQWLREQLAAGKAELIMAPHVTARNNRPSVVTFSRGLPWVWATTTYDEHGNRTVERHEQTIPLRHSLYVTPRIVGDNTVVLDLRAEIEKQVGIKRGYGGEPLPNIETQSASLEVVVPDGGTTVVGGFTSISESHRSPTTAPVEGTLVGEIFRKRLAAEQNKELLIFVTPKVIPGTAPSALPVAPVISREIRDGEQWVWDQIAVRYAEATEVARTFGGMVFRDGEISSPPPAKQHPSPPGVERPYASGAGAVTLPLGMDPPLAVVQQNVLLVHGTQDAIDKFREILAFFDKPAKQIEIEARFVEVEWKEDTPFGLDWFVAGGSAEFFNLGFKPGRGINVARFRQGRFESELRVLLTEGRAELRHAPRVTARNNQPATVSFSREIPYYYATVSYDEHGKREVDFEPETVAITQSLTVTPRILEDNSVVLHLVPQTQNQVGTLIGPNGEVLPKIETRSASVQVRVGDGETIVIGGLTRTTEVVDPEQVLPPEETAETEASEETKRVRKELLIFVTPRILREIPRQ